MTLLDGALGLIVVTALAMAAARRLDRMIRLLGLQGAAAAGVAAALAHATGRDEMYLVALAALLVKAVAVPAVLGAVLARAGIPRDAESVISMPQSVGVAGALLLLAHAAARTVGPAVSPAVPGLLPVALGLLLVGFFLCVSRRKAITQVMGLIVAENGILLAAISATLGLDLAVELGIAATVLTGVLIMAALALRINHAFDSLDTGRLTSLRG